MVIAALVSFAALFVAWLVAPNRNGLAQAAPMEAELNLMEEAA
jgi:hypothetical protein